MVANQRLLLKGEFLYTSKIVEAPSKEVWFLSADIRSMRSTVVVFPMHLEITRGPFALAFTCRVTHCSPHC